MQCLDRKHRTGQDLGTLTQGCGTVKEDHQLRSYEPLESIIISLLNMYVQPGDILNDKVGLKIFHKWLELFQWSSSSSSSFQVSGVTFPMAAWKEIDMRVCWVCILAVTDQ